MTSLDDAFGPALVLDASVLINFLAVPDPAKILAALPSPTVVSEVAQEITRHPVTSLPGAGTLAQLLSGPLRHVTLDDLDAERLVDLVSAPHPDDLDDGEAATIAYASRRGFTSVIDERKAQRVIGRQTDWRTLTTVGVYRGLLSTGQFSRSFISRCVLDSLRHARMRVITGEMEWISDLLTPEQLAHCSSIRRHYRGR